MMRVLHVIGAMDRGGAETTVMNLYRAVDRDVVQFDILVHEGRAFVPRAAFQRGEPVSLCTPLPQGVRGAS